MSMNEKIRTFFLKYSYLQKIMVVVVVTIIVTFSIVIALTYTGYGLYHDSLLDKTTFPIQQNLIKIGNLIARQQLEIQNRQSSLNSLNEKALKETEKEIDKEIKAFRSSVDKYQAAQTEDISRIKTQLRISQFDELVKNWNSYTKISSQKSPKNEYEDFAMLVREFLIYQTGLQDYFKMTLNDDEGTKRLINASFVAIPKLTFQIPLFYALVSEDVETSWVPVQRKTDLYGTVLRMTEAAESLLQSLKGVSGKIDPSLQTDTNGRIQQLLENIAAANVEVLRKIEDGMKDVPKDNAASELEAYNISKNALRVYGEAQLEINGMLNSLINLQEESLHFRLFAGYWLMPIAIVIIFVVYFTRMIIMPIRELANAANDLGVGKVDVRVPIHFKDEVGEMGAGFNALAIFLENRLHEVKTVSQSLLQSVNVIFRVAQNLEANTVAQDRELDSIKGHTKEITVLVKEFALNLANVYKSIQVTTGFASLGRTSLSEMEQVMHQMVEASQGIVNTLNTLNQKINSINDVISTIVKIADQVNLLALNTAIQANKAGPEGKGFAVIAKKIKELSGQTAFSTLDIEETVQQIIASVNSEVVEVHRFLQKVLLQVSESTQLSEEFKNLIRFFQHQVEVFESVNEDMSKQAESATEIQGVLYDLSDASKRTKLSVNQFYREIEFLYHSTTNLVDKIDSFTHPDYHATAGFSSKSTEDNSSKVPSIKV